MRRLILKSNLVYYSLFCTKEKFLYEPIRAPPSVEERLTERPQCPCVLVQKWQNKSAPSVKERPCCLKGAPLPERKMARFRGRLRGALLTPQSNENKNISEELFPIILS